MKRAVISVVSDLVTDQRVNRTSLTLHQMGYQVTLVGRRLKASLPVDKRDYQTVRFRLWWDKGMMFYASYNLRLFFYLLKYRSAIYVANDLDTLPANFLASKLTGSRLYYDSHEYFTGVPELSARPRVRNFWKAIERIILPRLKKVYTVNDSIAGLYEEEYGIKVSVIRNVPITQPGNVNVKSRAELGLPHDKWIFLFQGAGINIQRGAEESVEAIRNLDNCILLFIGSGDIIEKLKEEILKKNLRDKVFFIPKQPFEVLQQYSRVADIGITLDKDTNINYRYSLPNKLFDYIHSGLPVLASDLPEVRKIIDQYKIGMICPSHEPAKISDVMAEMTRDKDRFAQWKQNLKFAASELCWEKEKEKLIELFKDAG